MVKESLAVLICYHLHFDVGAIIGIVGEHLRGMQNSSIIYSGHKEVGALLAEQHSIGGFKPCEVLVTKGPQRERLPVR